MDSDGITFDVEADIIVELKNGNSGFQLEAFKSKINKQSKENKEFSQMKWFSFGQPTLLLHNNDTNENGDQIKSAIHFNSTGFYIEIQMLTDEQRQHLIDNIKRNYQIPVITKEQIISLIPNQFECSVKFESEDKPGTWMNLKGYVQDFRTFPYRCEFEFPRQLREQIKKSLQTVEKEYGLAFICQLSTKSKKTQINTLKIDAHKLNDLGLLDNLFGDASSTFVTRNQIADLTNKLNTELHIMEDYNIPNKEFDSSFVNDLIKQTSENMFELIPFDQAIEGLSKFSDKDLNPDLIKSELSKVFQVEKTAEKSHIVLNKEIEKSEKGKNGTKLDALMDVGAMFKSIPVGIKASVNEMYDKEQDLSTSRKSLDDQLEDLNRETNDQIEWKFEGEKIVPKRIMVAKLIRAKFEKSLTFSRIRKETFENVFERKFTLNTLDTFNRLKQMTEEATSKSSTQSNDSVTGAHSALKIQPIKTTNIQNEPKFMTCRCLSNDIVFNPNCHKNHFNQ